VKRLITLFIFLTLVSPSIWAKYKGKYADFAEGPASHLMTKDEVKDFKKIKTDADAEEYIALFWARRDPTPETATNEYKDLFDVRVAVADRDFGTEFQKGSMTDRGKIFIVFGPPTARKVSDYQGASGSTDEIGVTSEGSGGGKYGKAFVTGQIEIWIYRKDRLPNCVQQHEVMFKFLKEEKAKDFTMDRTVAQVLQSIELAKECTILHADLKEAPVIAKAVVLGPSALLTHTMNLVKGEASANTEKGFLEIAPFFADRDTPFLAVHIFLPEAKWSGAAPEQHVAYYVEDASGLPIVKAEEDVALISTPGGFYVDRSIILLPGAYKLGVSLGKTDGSIDFSKLEEVTIPDYTQDTSEGLWFTLSCDVKPLSQAQFVTDAYAFGGIKVVPKSDNIFKVSQDLWGFGNVFFPKLDEAGIPKLTFKIEFYTDGKRVRKTAEMEVQPTMLAEGRYAFGQAYNIGMDLKLEPGAYTYKMTVKDKLSGKEWEKARDFTVVE